MYGLARINEKPKDRTPTLYVLGAKGLRRFVDLRCADNKDRFLPGFSDYMDRLRNQLKEGAIPGFEHFWDERINRIRSAVSSGSANYSLKDVAWGIGGLFTAFYIDQGYNGVISTEMVDGQHGVNADSWVVFDPLVLTVKSKHMIPQIYVNGTGRQ